MREDIAGSIDCVMKLPDGTLALIDWKREEVLLQHDFIGECNFMFGVLGSAIPRWMVSSKG